MRRIGFAVILLVSLSAPAWADLEEGVAAYERGDYATAYREFLPLAEQGYARAQHNLGVMYHNGEGVPQDYAEAVRWYRKAAEQGLAEGQWSLGFMYDSGEGVPQDYGEAAWWYRKAAEQGPPLTWDQAAVSLWKWEAERSVMAHLLNARLF